VNVDSAKSETTNAVDAGPTDAGQRVVRELSVFFPFYNEQANIERVVQQAIDVLTRLALKYELILVDDGSHDRTYALAQSLAVTYPHIRVIRNRVNLGYGAALRRGIRAARYEWVFYTDGDGQFDMNHLDALLPMAKQYDIVAAYRVGRRDNFVRRFNAACWNLLVNMELGLNVRDVDSAFKLYRRQVFRQMRLKSRGALISAEILARARQAGFTIGQIGVPHLRRLAGSPTGGRIGVIVKAFGELLALRKDIRHRSPDT
jgi:glycosyltransferase involved in cell wall biosynthesis